MKNETTAEAITRLEAQFNFALGNLSAREQYHIRQEIEVLSDKQRREAEANTNQRRTR